MSLVLTNRRYSGSQRPSETIEFSMPARRKRPGTRSQSGPVAPILLRSWSMPCTGGFDQTDLGWLIENRHVDPRHRLLLLDYMCRPREDQRIYQPKSWAILSKHRRMLAGFARICEERVIYRKYIWIIENGPLPDELNRIVAGYYYNHGGMKDDIL